MSSTLAIVLSALAMTVIVGVRYLRRPPARSRSRRGRGIPACTAGSIAQMRREIGWSLASAAIYGVPAGVVAWGWQHRGWTRDLHATSRAYPLWYLPVSVLLYLLAHDAWFYWTHRWMHRPGPFRLAHAVHHASRPPTAWAAMAFHPIEALTGAVAIPLLVFVIPIHVAALGHSAGGHDGYGGDQPYGVGGFPAVHVAGAIGGLADHRQPSSAPPRAIWVQLWPLFPPSGTGCAAPTAASAISRARACAGARRALARAALRAAGDAGGRGAGVAAGRGAR